MRAVTWHTVASKKVHDPRSSQYNRYQISGHDPEKLNFDPDFAINARHVNVRFVLLLFVLIIFIYFIPFLYPGYDQTVRNWFPLAPFPLI